MSVEPSIITTGGGVEGTSEITTQWFGAIQTGFRGTGGFEYAAKEIGIGLLRWPGGTLSETRPEVYGLDIPGIFDATDLWSHNPDRQRPDLAQSLEYAVTNQIAFSMIVPTARYKNDLQTGEMHLRAFLEDLFTGDYGTLPETLTLELGNEFYALNAFADDPAAYGLVASRFAELISEMVATHLSPEDQSRIDIAVQMGRSADENSLIMDAFSTEALAAVSSVVFHSLPISLQNLNRLHDDRDGLTRYDAAANQFDPWQQAISAAGGAPDPDLFLSAWAVGGSGGADGEANTVWHEYGSRSLAMVLDTFAGYSSIGVDAAAVWGLNSEHNNRVSSADGTSSEFTHIGELLALMSQSLPGMTFQGEFTAHSRQDETMTWSFGDGTDYVSYIGINDLDGAPRNHFVSYEDVSNFRVNSATLIGTEYAPDFTGSPTDPEASLYEVPIVEDLQFEFSLAGINFSFDSSYELVELAISENVGTTGSARSDWISGTESSEQFEGFAGDDFVFAGGGNDTIVGGEGADQLIGDLGDDLIFGDSAASDAWIAYLRDLEGVSVPAHAQSVDNPLTDIADWQADYVHDVVADSDFI